MRPTCTFCARKHLAQASILVNEAAMGYPAHLWLAIGHMAEASEELISTYPDMANQIRVARKGLELGNVVDFMALIEGVGKLGAANTYPSPLAMQAYDDAGRPVIPTPVTYVPTPVPAPHFVTGLSTGPIAAPALTYRSGGTIPAPDWVAPPVIGPAVPTPPAGLLPPPRYYKLPPELVEAGKLLPPPGHPDNARAVAEFQKRMMDDFAAKTGSRPSLPPADGGGGGGGPPTPCLTCGDKAPLTQAAVVLQTVMKPRIAILTTLADFNPSYSLVSVILEQAHAAVLAGYHVLLLVHRGANMSECPPLPPEITALPIVPAVSWQDDVIDPTAVQTFFDAMREWFQVLAPKNPLFMATMQPMTVITHDLLFQSAYVSFAKAIHEYALMSMAMGSPTSSLAPSMSMAMGSPTSSLAPSMSMAPLIEWYHMAHSSVGERPFCIGPNDASAASLTSIGPEQVARAMARWYRCTLPPGHRLIALNYADVPHFRAYYHTDDGSGTYGPLPAEAVHTLLNSKDIRPYLRMTQRASRLTTRYQLHRADVTVIYPFSLTRTFEKGVDKVIALLGAMKRSGDDPPSQATVVVRLLLIVAHANDRVEAPKIIARIKEHALKAGLTEDEVILTCEAEPDTAAYGLSADDVRSLWGVANLFIFPTTSEAGSLVLMEAALAGVTMVLNGSLPALKDYVQAQEAIWIPWGSVKQPGAPLAQSQLDDLAGRVWERMQRNEGMLLKRRMMATHSLEAYGQALHEMLSPTVPDTDGEGDEQDEDGGYPVPPSDQKVGSNMAEAMQELGDDLYDEVGLASDRPGTASVGDGLVSDESPLAKLRAAYLSENPMGFLAIKVNDRLLHRDDGVTTNMNSKQIAALVGIQEGKVCRCDHLGVPLPAPSDDSEYVLLGVRSSCTWGIKPGDAFLVTRERAPLEVARKIQAAAAKVVPRRFKIGDTVRIVKMTEATAHYRFEGKTAIVDELQAVDDEPWCHLRCDGARGSLPESCLEAV